MINNTKLLITPCNYEYLYAYGCYKTNIRLSNSRWSKQMWIESHWFLAIFNIYLKQITQYRTISIPSDIYMYYMPTDRWLYLEHGVHLDLIKCHYCDVIMGSMASQITSLMIVYSTVHLGTDQRKHQSSASLAFVRGIHRWPVNSSHKWPATRKIFPFDDVIVVIVIYDIITCP